MAVRVDYVVRETTNNLLRNLLLTFASVITFTVSLGILGELCSSKRVWTTPSPSGAMTLSSSST